MANTQIVVANFFRNSTIFLASTTCPVPPTAAFHRVFGVAAHVMLEESVWRCLGGGDSVAFAVCTRVAFCFSSPALIVGSRMSISLSLYSRRWTWSLWGLRRQAWAPTIRTRPDELAWSAPHFMIRVHGRNDSVGMYVGIIRTITKFIYVSSLQGNFIDVCSTQTATDH
jgi:hypothetical protein